MKPGAAIVGIADHGGWAVAMTATADGALLDRRRVELVDAGMPPLPHHHEGQSLPLPEAVALVARVQQSAEHNARARLAEIAASVASPVVAIALRDLPSLPPTIAERITSYRAMCVADWVMYRTALADAATARGWRVVWYDQKTVFAAAADVLGVPRLDEQLAAVGAAAGRPWQKDHKLALAAAIAAFGKAASD